MDAKKELARIIREVCIEWEISPYIEDSDEFANALIEAIFSDSAFTDKLLKLVEIDVEKLKEIILPSGEVHPFLTTGDGKQYYFCNVEGIIKTIHEAKGILKIKGVKG